MSSLPRSAYLLRRKEPRRSLLLQVPSIRLRTVTRKEQGQRQMARQSSLADESVAASGGRPIERQTIPLSSGLDGIYMGSNKHSPRQPTQVLLFIPDVNQYNQLYHNHN